MNHLHCKQLCARIFLSCRASEWSEKKSINEFVYYSNGAPMKDANGEIALPRERVVRCRDCRYFSIGTNTDRCAFTEKYAHPGWFCSWGERNTNEGYAE